MKSLLIMIQKSPYGTSLVAEGFRFAIGTASMGVDTKVVLLNDGVFTVTEGHDPTPIGMKPLNEAFANIGEYGVELLVVEEHLKERGLTQGMLRAGRVVPMAELRRMVDEAEGIIRF